MKKSVRPVHLVLMVMLAILATLISPPVQSEAISNVTQSTPGNVFFKPVHPYVTTISFTTTDLVPAGNKIAFGFNSVNSAIASTACVKLVTTSCAGVQVSAVDSQGAAVAFSGFSYQRAALTVGGSYPYTYFWVGTNPLPAGSTVTIQLAADSLNLGTGNPGLNNVITYGVLSDGTVNDDVAYGGYFNPVTAKVVTFDANSLAATGSMNTQSGGSSSPLSANQFSRPGYTFSNWTTAADGTGTAYADGANFPFTASATLYAKWTANSNAVIYDSTGGSSVSNGSFLTGGSFNLASAPTRSGYSFDGWFTAASGGSALTSPYTPGATSGITLYAQWTSTSRSVTFDSNGGSGTMTTQSSGPAANLTNNTFSRNGYYFEGWNTSSNGSGTAYANGASYPFTSSVTLYAQWRAIPAAPSAQVDIQVPIGQPIANAPVALVADGLMDQTGYTVTVHSTPQIIDQGTIWSGRLNTTVRIPSNLESGWHRLVIEGTAADGTPWVEETFFKVSASGTLLATADAPPAELAMTGQNINLISSASFLGGALLLFGVSFMVANVSLGRRAKRRQAK